MGFLDSVKNTMKDVKEASSPEKIKANSTNKIKELLSTLLLEDEKMVNLYGSELGFVGFTEYRILIGTCFPSSTKPGKAITSIAYSKITHIGYEYAWGAILKSYRVNIGVGSVNYEVDLYTKEEALKVHKELNSLLLIR